MCRITRTAYKYICKQPCSCSTVRFPKMMAPAEIGSFRTCSTRIQRSHMYPLFTSPFLRLLGGVEGQKRDGVVVPFEMIFLGRNGPYSSRAGHARVSIPGSTAKQKAAAKGRTQKVCTPDESQTIAELVNTVVPVLLPLVVKG